MAAPALTSAMERVHILFLIDVLYSTRGGAEGILRKLTRLLPRDRYRCSVATFASVPEYVASEHFDCPVHMFPIHRTYDWRALKAAFRLGRLIREERVSIVHTFFPASDLLGGVAAKLSGCPILVSSRRDMGFQRTTAHRLAYRLARRLYDQVHAVGEQVRALHIRQDALDPAKVVTVHNGVDLDEIDRARALSRPADLGLDDTDQLVACVANIRPIKGLDTLVRTASIVCRRMPRVRFLVAGGFGGAQDAPYVQWLTELTRHLGVSENVKFAGVSKEVPSLLKASDVFYLPSRSEGLSNALLEAMACAVPCVVTDVGGNPELVTDELSGYLVPVDDAEAAAARIQMLLEDRPLAGRMGRAARRTVEESFSVETMVTRLIELYEGLLAGTADGGTRHGEYAHSRRGR